MNSPNDNQAPRKQPTPIRYLTPSDLYNINVEVMNGDTLVRDLHLLTSAARRPFLSFFGQPQFPTVIDKAAALLHSLAYHHLFMDGNKRTALIAVTRFLEMNDYEVAWDAQVEHDFILDVAQGKHDVPAIAEWLAQYVRPMNP
jgi:death-on-curing protein